MWTCEDCGDRYKETDGKYEDMRSEPLGEGYCLCINCFKNSCRDAIGEHLQEVERITDEMLSCVNEVRE